MKPALTVVHISDLHFVAELTERGRRLWLKRLDSHAHGTLMALSRSIEKIHKEQDIELDALVVTGDVSTDGARASLETAQRYIHQYQIYEGTPQRLKCYGLNMPAGRRSIVLPGNHDRYAGAVWQSRSDELEQVFPELGFGAPVKYPYAVGLRRGKMSDEGRNPTLIFFVFDSTLPGESVEGSITGDRVACGYVGAAECEWLVKQKDEIKKNRTVQALDGASIVVDYDSALKIVVLHHHPVHETGAASRKSVGSTVLDVMARGEGLVDKVRRMPSNVAAAVRYVRDERMTLMYNAEQFVESCYEAGAHLVLFGHEHRAYDLRHARDGWRRPLDFFCCPSSAEHSVKENGFYLFKFYADRYTVQPYLYNDRRDSAGIPTSFVEGTPLERSYPGSLTFPW